MDKEPGIMPQNIFELVSYQMPTAASCHWRITACTKNLTSVFYSRLFPQQNEGDMKPMSPFTQQRPAQPSSHRTWRTILRRDSNYVTINLRSLAQQNKPRDKPRNLIMLRMTFKWSLQVMFMILRGALALFRRLPINCWYEGLEPDWMTV